MEGPQVKKLGLLGVFLGLLILVAMIFLPFATVFLWSALFYSFLFPIFRKLAVRKDGKDRSGLARTGIAVGLALGGVLLIAVPGVLLGLSMVRQLGAMIHSALVSIEKNPSIIGFTPDGAIATFLFSISDGSIDISKLNIVEEIRTIVNLRMDRIIVLSGQFLKLTGSLLISLVFMVFTIYFLLIDGRHLAKVLIGAMPIEKSYTEIFLRKFRDMGKHLVTGYFFIALLQAILMLVLCGVFSVKGGLVIGFLTALASFIPMVGTTLVLLPVAAAKFMAGDVTGALLFFAVSIALVWTIDTFVRPLLLEGRLKIHPLLILFSILGGLSVFKFNGIILGPLILILFFTAIELYEKAYDAPLEDQNRRKGDCADGESGNQKES